MVTRGRAYWAFRLAGLLERIADRIEAWGVAQTAYKAPPRPATYATGRIVREERAAPVIIDFDGTLGEECDHDWWPRQQGALEFCVRCRITRPATLDDWDPRRSERRG